MERKPQELKELRRRLTTARREIRRAVERFAEIDPLEGHRKEAARLAGEVKREADALVRTLE